MSRIVTACGQTKPRRRTYFRQRAGWPQWRFDAAALAAALAEVHRAQATLQALTQEVITTSAIEGEALSREAVRSSIARRLGVDIGALAPADRHVDGVVDMVLDATQRFAEPLTAERLFGWHAALFPTGYSGRLRIQTGAWRNDAAGPMQVVSGPIGRETVHYEAPPAARLPAETAALLDWFNHSLSQGDPLVHAGLAHLWLVTLHPFDDGNGRISRAVGDMALARAEGSAQRFYSLSAQIQLERKHYYEQLETTQRGTLDVTPWLAWFLGCLLRAVQRADGLVADVLAKAQFWQRWADAPMNARQTLALNRVLGGMEGKLNNAEWAALAKCSRRHTGPPINQSTRPCHQSFHHGLWGMGRTTLVLGSYSQSAGCV